MNHRDYKKFAPNTFHHVFNRGNGKRDIFLDEKDYQFFLFRLKESLFPEAPLMVPIEDGNHQGKTHTPYKRRILPAGSFTLLTYCLMPNHFHFAIKQEGEVPISKLISKICTSYGKYFNKKYDTAGGLFQNAFKSVLVENDEQLLWLSAYIHNNPKTAGLVQKPIDWPYGSYPDYLELRPGTLVNKSQILGLAGGKVELYKKFVSAAATKIKERKDLEQLWLDC